MYELRTTLGEDGRIVIPALCRKQLKLTPGMELAIQMQGNTLSLMSTDELLKQAQTLVKQYAKGQSLTKKLKLMREEEVSSES